MFEKSVHLKMRNYFRAEGDCLFSVVSLFFFLRLTLLSSCVKREGERERERERERDTHTHTHTHTRARARAHTHTHTHTHTHSHTHKERQRQTQREAHTGGLVEGDADGREGQTANQPYTSDPPGRSKANKALVLVK